MILVIVGACGSGKSLLLANLEPHLGAVRVFDECQGLPDECAAILAVHRAGAVALVACQEWRVLPPAVRAAAFVVGMVNRPVEYR